MYQSYANNMGYSPTQMRLNQMEQMYPQYNNQMMYNNQYQGNQQLPQNNGNSLKGRPVTSLEEARMLNPMQMLGMMNNMKNPQQMIMNIAKQNPQMNMAMQMMGGVKDKKKAMKEVKMMQQMHK